MSTTLTTYRPPRIAFTMLAVAATINWIVPIADDVVFAAPWTGAAFLLAGFGVMMWAWWLFQRHAVAVCPTDPTDRLLTGGIYAMTRNPMYLGMITMMLGVALCFGTLPFYIAALAYFVFIDRVFCVYEEEKLEAAFGDEYRRYRARVRRWL